MVWMGIKVEGIGVWPLSLKAGEGYRRNTSKNGKRIMEIEI